MAKVSLKYALTRVYNALLGRIKALESAVGSSSMSSKADKVSGATNGNFAGLDGNGNIIDSGKSPADLTRTEKLAKAALVL